jgi:hypothetical protein
MRLRRTHRRTLEALVTAGLATVAATTSAQEPPPPPPPVNVPTEPVAPPPATPPPSAPKAAPAAPKDAPKDKPKDGAAGDAKAGDKTAEPSTPAVNNEGVFRISGSKGTGKATAKGTGKAAPKKPVEQGLIAQWPGFHLTSDGGSEVMVEFSKTLPAPTEHRAKGSITYVFKGARITKHNNSNPLVTVHFNTPIAVARLVPKGADVHLVIELRGGAEALPTTGIRAGTEGAGAQFFAKFAPGHFIDEAAEGDEVPIGGRKTLKADGSKDGAKDGKKSDTPPPTTKPSDSTTTPSGSKTGPQP